jgi:hypothetical protein
MGQSESARLTVICWSINLKTAGADVCRSAAGRYPLAKLFAETKLGVGASSAVAFDRWSGQNLFRSSSYAQWREQLHATEWTQVFIVAHVTQLMQPDRYPMRITGEDLASGFGARLLAGGATTRATDYYETGIFLKRPLRGHWLFGSILPLVRWERVHD